MTGENATAAEAGGDTRERMEGALREIRREGWKAACIHAVVDAVAVTLAVNLAVTILDPPWTPAELLGTTGPVSVSRGTLLGVGLGAVVLAAEVGWWARQPLVERFEAGNPTVAEALRTARDAVESDADSPMTERLYADVLERLRGTSSLALIDLRRVAVTVVLVLVLSVASVQTAVYDVSLGGDEPGTDSGAGEPSVEYSGLQDGESVLGEPGAAESGDENLTARIDSTGGDEEVDDPGEFPDAPGADPDGPGSDAAVEGQQAGFERQEEIEDAELVREYNVRIRERRED